MDALGGARTIILGLLRKQPPKIEDEAGCFFIKGFAIFTRLPIIGNKLVRVPLKKRDNLSMGQDKPNPVSVLLLTRYDRKGASSRLRFLDTIGGLEKSGVTISSKPFFDDQYLENLYQGKRLSIWKFSVYLVRRIWALLSVKKYDLVWIEKEAFPWLPFFLEKIFLRSAPYVVDFDDAWHLRYQEHRLSLIRRLLGKKMERIVASSALAVMGNAYLSDWARQAGARKILNLPTTLDPNRYQLAVRPTDEDVQRPLVVGWVGSPSSVKLLRTIEPVLTELVQAGEIVVRVVGAVSERLTFCPAQYLDWSEDSESNTIAGFDVGIMPLEDTEWSRAKCAYKLLQYMAAGLPVIASPVGMNCEVVTPEENGFLPTTAEEWRQAFRRLKNDPALRIEMGRRNRERVKTRYSLDYAVEILAQALREVVTENPPGCRQ